MYARIARFEGGSPETIQRETERLRHDLAAVRAGQATEPLLAALSRVVDRVLMLVDRENATTTTIIFCETREKLLEADRLPQEMSPQGGYGRRASRDLLEVAVDESPRAQKKAA